MSSKLLSDFTFVITRPCDQAHALSDRLEQDGASIISCPSLFIAPLDEELLQQQAFDKTLNQDIVIFLSVNAVNYFFSYCSLSDFLKHKIQIAAVGPVTAKGLESKGLTVSILPKTRYSTEGLLSELALQNVTNKSIMLVRGLRGREKLSQTLEERGANLTELSVYQRLPLSIDSDVIKARCLSAKNSVVWISTSAEGLQNLFEQSNDKPWFLNQFLLIVSERLKKMAINLGFSPEKILLADNANDETIFDYLCSYARGKHHV